MRISSAGVSKRNPDSGSDAGKESDSEATEYEPSASASDSDAGSGGHTGGDGSSDSVSGSDGQPRGNSGRGGGRGRRGAAQHRTEGARVFKRKDRVYCGVTHRGTGFVAHLANLTPEAEAELGVKSRKAVGTFETAAAAARVCDLGWLAVLGVDRCVQVRRRTTSVLHC